MNPMYQKLFRQYANLVTQAEHATGTPQAIEEYKKVVAFEKELEKHYAEFQKQGYIVGNPSYRKTFMESLAKLAVRRGTSQPEHVAQWDRKIEEYIAKGFQPASIIPKSQNKKWQLPIIAHHRKTVR